MNSMHILLVEDDRRMAALLGKGLGEEGHVVDRTASGVEALDLLASAEFDVVVLDVMLPDIEGFEIVRRLRTGGDRTPVLMLTARDAEEDVVCGLNTGADDYVTKPFSFDVLLARLQALARRGPPVQSTPLQIGDLVVDPSIHRATRAGLPLALTRTEFSLLECLMRRSGRVVPRQSLIDVVWGCERQVEDNTLDAWIKLLRRKVDGIGQPSLIRTVRGVGYAIGMES
jgi:DNA-binding response OmpR family regulator